MSIIDLSEKRGILSRGSGRRSRKRGNQGHSYLGDGRAREARRRSGVVGSGYEQEVRLCEQARISKQKITKPCESSFILYAVGKRHRRIKRNNNHLATEKNKGARNPHVPILVAAAKLVGQEAAHENKHFGDNHLLLIHSEDEVQFLQDKCSI